MALMAEIRGEMELGGVREGMLVGVGVSCTCLSSQHEGCVSVFVLLVHIQERTAAEQSHNGAKAMVACHHEACLGTEQFGPHFPLSSP